MHVQQKICITEVLVEICSFDWQNLLPQRAGGQMLNTRSYLTLYEILKLVRSSHRTLKYHVVNVAVCNCTSDQGLHEASIQPHCWDSLYSQLLQTLQVLSHALTHLRFSLRQTSHPYHCSSLHVIIHIPICAGNWNWQSGIPSLVIFCFRMLSSPIINALKGNPKNNVRSSAQN